MKYFLPLIIALSIFINPVNAFAEELILAGGCFWCLEHDLESLKGINFVQREFDEKFREAFRKFQVKGKVISQKDNARLKPYIYSLTKIAFCKSGTVNMELALYGIPQIVGYRVSRITAFIAKKILNFKVKFISAVNLLVNKLIIPEFVQRAFAEKKIFYKSCRILLLS